MVKQVSSLRAVYRFVWGEEQSVLLTQPMSLFVICHLYGCLSACLPKLMLVRPFACVMPFVNQVIEMAPHLETVYVSGWQCSSTASTRYSSAPLSQLLCLPPLHE